jgi:hypothetical protein
MSTKYTIEWSIAGSTVIEAENHDEATAKFNTLSNQDLIEGNDEREVLDGPTSDEDRKREADEMASAWAFHRKMREEAKLKKPRRPAIGVLDLSELEKLKQ